MLYFKSSGVKQHYFFPFPAKTKLGFLTWYNIIDFLFYFVDIIWPLLLQVELDLQYKTGKVELYDLDTDIGETKDISKSRPTIADELDAKLLNYIQSLNPSIIEKFKK